MVETLVRCEVLWRYLLGEGCGGDTCWVRGVVETLVR